MTSTVCRPTKCSRNLTTWLSWWHNSLPSGSPSGVLLQQSKLSSRCWKRIFRPLKVNFEKVYRPRIHYAVSSMCAATACCSRDDSCLASGHFTSRYDSGQIVHTHATVNKQYDLLLSQEWYCYVAGKVTVVLSSHSIIPFCFSLSDHHCYTTNWTFVTLTDKPACQLSGPEGRCAPCLYPDGARLTLPLLPVSYVVIVML